MLSVVEMNIFNLCFDFHLKYCLFFPVGCQVGDGGMRQDRKPASFDRASQAVCYAELKCEASLLEFVNCTTQDHGRLLTVGGYHVFTKQRKKKK